MGRAEPRFHPMSTPLRIAPFLFALLCLLLPFAEVSCDSKDQSLGKLNMVKITGWELMTGHKQDDQQPQRVMNHDPNYLLITTAAVLILGLLAAASPTSRRFGIVCGTVAAGCLLFLTANLQEAVLPPNLPLQQLQQGAQIDISFRIPALEQLGNDLISKNLTVTPQPGLYAAIACALLAAILSALPASKPS